MSLFKKIIRGAGKLVGKAAGFIPGPVGTIAKVGLGVAGGLKAAKGTTMAALPAIPRSLPAIGNVARGAGKAIGRVGGAAATGAILYDAFGNPVSKRHRKINPLNHRALKRAIRRIEKSKHLAKSINAITIRKEKC